MIISRTPFRVSFVGGGSDMPVYYQRNGGAVLSTSIKKYVYVTINKRFDHTLRVSYSKTEEVEHADLLQHKLVRACLQKLNQDGGLEITSIADIPSRGSGLGSSSSFTVGLLHALHAFKGRYRSRFDLGAEACAVEIDICGEPIGKQDQFAAALGGLNLIRFNPDGSVDYEPVVAPIPFLREFEASLMMFYTGIVRSASDLLDKQGKAVASDEKKISVLDRMVALTGDLKREIQASNLDAIGDVLHENWVLKQSLTNGISSGAIDDWYARARAAGATGGKLLGAGGGGFLLFIAPREKHAAITSALHDLRPIDIKFDRQGSSIIFDHRD